MTPDPQMIPMPVLPKAPPPPIIAGAPQGSKPKRKSMQTSFLSDAVEPTSGSQVGKTLLGM